MIVMESSFTHRSPVSVEEVFGQRVEGEVAARTFGVMVGTREAGGGGSKATAGDQGGCLGGAKGGPGKHLFWLVCCYCTCALAYHTFVFCCFGIYAMGELELRDDEVEGGLVDHFRLIGLSALHNR